MIAESPARHAIWHVLPDFLLFLIWFLIWVFVEGRIEGIEVAAVQMILDIPQGFTEPLEVDDLPLPQETDGIADIVVFNHAQDVVVGGAGFLLCCQIFKKICDRVAL